MNLIRVVGKVVLICALSACTPNMQLRTEFVESNCLWGEVDCSKSAIEHYLEYDLGFIEFTERGNLYDRSSSQRVLSYIKRQAETEQGAAVFVFVHGWKHNADYDDSNVVQFRKFLSRAAENSVVGKRKVIGLYLGWRGAFTNLPFFKETTYWARKSVAEEVGSGGATEVFAKLHQILVAQAGLQSRDSELHKAELYKNSYVIIGHSFGGAIVLSALHDVLLNDLVASSASISDTIGSCKKINRFADALILLNPAIEANKVVLLKEAAAQCLFDDSQPPLMHILSSDGDTATRVFFPLGEYANVSSPSSPKKLKRKIKGKDIILDERQLSLTTAGNIKQFRTAYSSFDQTAKKWIMDNCSESLDKCGITDSNKQTNHFDVDEYDPLKFIKTDTAFIRNHNDAFGCYVQSFISSVVFETQYIEKGFDSSTQPKINAGCVNSSHGKFDFMQCFNSQIDDYDCAQPR
ncbi:MAG: hypothetical protein JKX81_12305 [Arenicella sp.]|nr:hypothetical protein [Arenicella sp.]